MSTTLQPATEVTDVRHLRIPFLRVQGIRCFSPAPDGWNHCRRKYRHTGRHFSVSGSIIFKVWR